jgi:hypothetical protein
LRTDRRGNASYEEFEVDTVGGQCNLVSVLQKVVDSILRDATEQAHTNAQADDSEEEAETVSSANDDDGEGSDESETEDYADPSEPQLRRDEYNPHAPVTEVRKS